MKIHHITKAGVEAGTMPQEVSSITQVLEEAEVSSFIKVTCIRTNARMKIVGTEMTPRVEDLRWLIS